LIKAVFFDLGDTLIEERVDDKEPLDHMDLQAKPGASEVLSRLSSRFRLALVTDTESSDEPVVRRALARLGLEQYFDAVVTSQDLGVTKPDSRAFREAMRRTRVNPGEAVMVGNDLDRDIQPATALGLHAILVQDSPYFDPERTTSVPMARTLADVPEMILAIDAASHVAKELP